MYSSEKRVIVVGQVPPPWGGQAVAIKMLVEMKSPGVDVQFVNMAFSRDMDEIGRFRFRKLLRLPALVTKIWWVRFSKHCSTLYYPPGGESITAVYRDIAVLLSCRLLFKQVIFHCHAGGFAQVANGAPRPIRVLARFAYRRPDLLIQLTDRSTSDGVLTKARRVICVPNGLPDDGARYVERFRDPMASQKVTLLFVGVVSPSKGVMVLLAACAKLKANGFHFVLRLVGRFYSSEFEHECKSFVQHHDLGGYVEFVGVIVGDDKWKTFSTSDIFCFPSYFEAENQPLVILEAMQFGLPIVATDWRSISTMVEDGETGYLVAINDPSAVAKCVGHLIQSPELRLKMGRKSREVFLERYTDVAWRLAMESALRGL